MGTPDKKRVALYYRVRRVKGLDVFCGNPRGIIFGMSRLARFWNCWRWRRRFVFNRRGVKAVPNQRCPTLQSSLCAIPYVIFVAFRDRGSIPSASIFPLLRKGISKMLSGLMNGLDNREA